MVMVFNATFNNISVLSWRSVDQILPEVYGTTLSWKFVFTTINTEILPWAVVVVIAW
jgi:hypothetical protein